MELKEKDSKYQCDLLDLKMLGRIFEIKIMIASSSAIHSLEG